MLPSKNPNRFLVAVSLIALAAGMTPVAAQAQVAVKADTTVEDDSKDIIVTGVRRALDTSAQIKKNAKTFVDSITATDIGAFPDKSAAEALQRIPGITVNRLQSADDSTHPSGEPTAVLIRGLNFVRTEFNGRDSFSADSARGLNFNDISPELLAGIDAYKNLTADMIEGGIAGTVNLRTRMPLDQKGLVVTGNIKANYGDRSKKWTPEFSALISNSWDTRAGRFGLLADFAYSHVITRTDSVIMDKIDTYCSSPTPIVDGVVTCTANPFGGKNFAYAPDGVRFSQVDYDRKRRGFVFAGEYENNPKTLHASIQYTNSKYNNAWIENASHAKLEGGYYGTPAFFPRTTTALGPADGTGPLVFGSNGMLQSGTLTQGHGSFRGTGNKFTNQEAIDTGSAVPGLPFVNNCGIDQCVNTGTRDGLYFENESRDFDHREGTRDLSANIRWDMSDRLHANFDAQRITASTANNDLIVATGSMANYQYSTNSAGTPQITLLPGSNVNYAPGGLANPHNYWIPFIQGHAERNNGKETALKADLKYDFARGSFLDSLKVGVRYADRKQTVRYSTFNWTPIAQNWSCNGPGFNADSSTPAAYPADCGKTGAFKGYGAGIFGPSDFGGFYNGSVYPNGSLVFVNRSVITDYDRLMKGLSGANTNSPIGSGYTPICDRSGSVDCFLPSEIVNLSEKTKSAYAMVDFGGDDSYFAGMSVVGNLGVRYIRTSEISDGSVGFPVATALASLLPCATLLGPNQVVQPSCYLKPAISAFASGGGTADTYRHSFNTFLPSFNVRFGLDSRNFVRFGISRAMSRPDIGLLRNYVQVNSPIINTSPDSPYVVYSSATAAHTAANVTGYNFVFQGNSGNAALRPVMATQADLSFERYMGRSSSFTVDAFYKRLTGLIAYGKSFRSLTNNGSTQLVQVNGPINSDGAGKLYGFEASYQTFFTFLPGLLNGLGMQANYTYVHQSGINNSNIINASSSGDLGAFGAGQQSFGGTGNVIDSHQLFGISKHSFNLVGLYEKGPVGVRVAYNWRSRYLTQNLDCCIGLPVFQKAAGFLDGSIRYSFGKHFELSADASNLLGTTTVYQQQIFGDSPLTPGVKPVYLDSAWNRVDRRYQLGLRAKF